MRATLSAKFPGAASVFISYSHHDEEFREELETHLSMLKRNGIVSVWHDRMIKAGDEWEGEISHHLLHADVILLLISPHFAESDYCWDTEMSLALRRHDEGKALVIPVIVRPVAGWESAPFGKLQALPDGAKPISTWTNRDDAYAAVAKGLERAIGAPASAHRLAEFVHWRIRLDSGGGKEAAERFVKILRQALAELRIELVKFTSGTMSLDLVSPKASLEQARQDFVDGTLAEKLGVPVLDISETWGALVRIRACGASAAVPLSPLIRPVALAEPFEPFITAMTIDPSMPVHPGFSLGCHPERMPDEKEVFDLTAKITRFLNILLIVTSDNLHANLSPHEEGCGLAKPLRRTELGLDLLRQDLLLKTETSLLLHPETQWGRSFWSTASVAGAVDSIMRVWIVPGNCELHQKSEGGKAVVELKQMELKVLCEDEHQGRHKRAADEDVESAFRSIVVPELQKRVNFGSGFSPLRQIFSVLIMARWMREEMSQIVALFGDTNDPHLYETPGIEEPIAEVKGDYLRHIEEGTWSYRYPPADGADQPHRLLTVGGIEFPEGPWGF
jgi:hypothetical protein